MSDGRRQRGIAISPSSGLAMCTPGRRRGDAGRSRRAPRPRPRPRRCRPPRPGDRPDSGGSPSRRRLPNTLKAIAAATDAGRRRHRQGQAEGHGRLAEGQGRQDRDEAARHRAPLPSPLPEPPPLAAPWPVVPPPAGARARSRSPGAVGRAGARIAGAAGDDPGDGVVAGGRAGRSVESSVGSGEAVARWAGRPAASVGAAAHAARIDGRRVGGIGRRRSARPCDAAAGWPSGRWWAGRWVRRSAAASAWASASGSAWAWARAWARASGPGVGGGVTVIVPAARASAKRSRLIASKVISCVPAGQLARPREADPGASSSRPRSGPSCGSCPRRARARSRRAIPRDSGRRR